MEKTNDKNLLSHLAILSKIAKDTKNAYKNTTKAREYLKARSLDPDKTEAGYIGNDFGKGWNKQLQEKALGTNGDGYRFL